VSEPLNVWDFERLAEEKVEPGPWGYFAGGAGDERTLAENVAAFRRWHLRPRMLVDVSSVQTGTTILGREVSLPVLVAPTAFQFLADPEGDRATARGAAAAGTVMCLSTLGGASAAELAEAAPGGRHWFQLYWSRDRGFTQSLVEAAADAGFEAIVLTVDFASAGRRERDLRAAFEIPPDTPLPNLAEHLGGGDFHATIGQVVDPTVTWRDLEWLRSVSSLPLLVKGILTEEDAQLACEHGVDGVVVSNHGGRQLDGTPASLDALPEVAEAVAGRCLVPHGRRHPARDRRGPWRWPSAHRPCSSADPLSGASRSTARTASGVCSSSCETRSSSPSGCSAAPPRARSRALTWAGTRSSSRPA
jgi:isopentenyl diphosphate isomerase/L-lactate dehydrogenase-like FMN-dependent dehydrogenase